MASGKWKASELEYLRRWWGTRSATNIGATLGRTRNSVIGKSHRLGLPDLGNPIGTGSTLHMKQRGERQPYKRRDETGVLKVTNVPRGGVQSAPRKYLGRELDVENPGTTLAARVSTSQLHAKKRAIAERPNNISLAATMRNNARHAEARATALPGPLPQQPPFTGQPVAFADLRNNGCKWAVTAHAVAPTAHRFCGEPCSGHRPYCAGHDQKSRGAGTPSERQAANV